MSSHDTTALDANSEERSADGVTGGRHEPAELLGRLEPRMAERGLRAHIYLTERSVVEFATCRNRTDRPLEDATSGRSRSGAFSRSYCVPETEPRSWLTRLRAVAAGRNRVRGPTLWNSPALVVARAIASRLCARWLSTTGLSGRTTHLDFVNQNFISEGVTYNYRPDPPGRGEGATTPGTPCITPRLPADGSPAAHTRHRVGDQPDRDVLIRRFSKCVAARCH